MSVWPCRYHPTCGIKMVEPLAKARHHTCVGKATSMGAYHEVGKCKVTGAEILAVGPQMYLPERLGI